MITNGNADTERTRIIDAVDRVLQQDDLAKSFALRVVTEHVEMQSYGWSVPVASGTMTGSAYDLTRAIQHAQELAEKATNEDLSLYLDPFED